MITGQTWSILIRMRRKRLPVLGSCVAMVVLAGAVALFYTAAGTAATGLTALRVPPGFTVERVAGADLVTYPMMGTVDERGRLFLCESSGNTLNNAQMTANPDY